jgi:hypothetical protein
MATRSLDGYDPLICVHGEALATSSVTNAPDSPRKRVCELRNSEDNDGEMTIESYLYQTNLYRSSTIPNPPPYPVEITEVPEENFQPHYTQIEKKLYQHGFLNIHSLVETTTSTPLSSKS